MKKRILITGSTDGIGLETAVVLADAGHEVILHGRSEAKLEEARAVVAGNPDAWLGDFADMKDVARLGNEILEKYAQLDVLINNAGVLNPKITRTVDDLDVRFAVNTYAPFLLTKSLLPILPLTARVVNISSAAQAPVSLAALKGEVEIARDFEAYAESKLALIMWTNNWVARGGVDFPMMVSVNPGSLLGTKMVREGFGQKGNDVQIGVDILSRAALSDEFAGASGLYFDNDAKQFAPPHPDALDAQKCLAVNDTIAKRLGEIL